MSRLKLKIDQSYFDRSGDIIKITTQTEFKDSRGKMRPIFLDEEGSSYHPDGTFQREHMISDKDLVKESEHGPRSQLVEEFIAISRLEPKTKEAITSVVLNELKMSGFNPFIFDPFERTRPQ